jgi:APA family basic amino acid/polyamine antiporter
VPALILNMDLVVDLTSIGTLFAFALVCGGILIIDPYGKSEARFKVPYINGKWLVPLILALGAYLVFRFNATGNHEFWLDATGQHGWLQIDASSGKVTGGFAHQIPTLVFLLFCVSMSVLSFRKRLSLLPTLGLLINLYLMTELGISNWTLFFVWLLIGLAVYFGYGYKNSKLGKVAVAPVAQ